jgi:putative ABC transport system substrate-binding protein
MCRWHSTMVRLCFLMALLLPMVVSAQSKVPRLCFLTFDPGTAQSPSPRFDAFFQGLRNLGYVGGNTIAIDYLSANGRSERFPALAAECVRLKADVIAASTTPAALAAKSGTSTIPIVMLGLGDPVGTGIVDSLARPGGNVTGMSSLTTELAVKRLQLLKQAVPRISRVLVLAYLVDPIAPLQVKTLKEAASSLGMTLHIHDIRTADDLSAAFDAGAREGVEGLLTTSASIFHVQRAQVAELAGRRGLPAIYPFSAVAVESGGLMAYEVIESDLHRRAAIYVDRILKGAKPSDLAVQQPTKFKLVINLKTAKALGLTISSSVLLQADEVIQ